MERRALCLFSAVMLLSAAGAADPVAAEDGTAPNEVSQDHGQSDGKLGTAQIAPTPAGQSDGKVGTAQIAPAPSAEEPLERRLAARGMKLGQPIMIRIFKAEGTLELWMKVGDRYELFAIYPICNWSGTLGPKLSEGDKQSPEGLYTIGRRQLHHSARWRRSLDLGFPNAFDRAHARTGSYVLLHGGCTSTGCFAMSDPTIEEIFLLSRAALWRGQYRIQVHVFPFRMTTENLAAHPDTYWLGFWTNLKEAYDLFERTRLPPSVSVCNRRYVISEAPADDDDCQVNVSAVEKTRQQTSLVRRSALHRRPARNAIRAYAAARRARLAAKAKQRRTAQASGQAAAQRKLPR